MRLPFDSSSVRFHAVIQTVDLLVFVTRVGRLVVTSALVAGGCSAMLPKEMVTSRDAWKGEQKEQGSKRFSHYAYSCTDPQRARAMPLVQRRYNWGRGLSLKVSYFGHVFAPQLILLHLARRPYSATPLGAWPVHQDCMSPAWHKTMFCNFHSANSIGN